MSDLQYRFLLPGDICILKGTEAANDGLGREVMIIGSYAMVCHVHMQSRTMVEGGLDNRHFHEYKVMAADGSTCAWINRNDLTFKERRGVEYFMRRMYRMMLEYPNVYDADLLGTLTPTTMEAVIHSNYTTILFNPPDKDTLIEVKVKALDEATSTVVIETLDGENYSDVPVSALYIDMTSPTKPITRDCCEKHCVIGSEDVL